MRQSFRDLVEGLAARRKVNVGDLPDRSVGGAAGHRRRLPRPWRTADEDRETVVSNRVRRKAALAAQAALQVRMPPGHDIPFIRRALALAIAMDKGDVAVSVASGSRIEEQRVKREEQRAKGEEQKLARLVEINEELDRLRTIVRCWLSNPCRMASAPAAMRCMSAVSRPVPSPIRGRCGRNSAMLATIHHPDSHYGSHQRMSQLNQAMESFAIAWRKERGPSAKAQKKGRKDIPAFSHCAAVRLVAAVAHQTEQHHEQVDEVQIEGQRTHDRLLPGESLSSAAQYISLIFWVSQAVRPAKCRRRRPK